MLEIAQLAELDSQDKFLILPLKNVEELISWQKQGKVPKFCTLASLAKNKSGEGEGLFLPNFDDMMLSPSQELLALAIGVGGHNSFLVGHPGCGKSMFAARLPSIMPPMERKTHIEALRIHSALRDSLSPSILKGQVSFRSPHHGASASALLGGKDEPGELALAHGGILFLDEFPEFRRISLSR